MFKLKVVENNKRIKERLNLVESTEYKYVLTNDQSKTEDDKLNIVFSERQITELSELLDWIVKGETVYITGYNEYGTKRVDSDNFLYFIVEDQELYGVLHKTKLLIKLKLYELDKLLKEKPFIRVSKYAIVNIGKIEYIKPALNSKLDLLMKNNDHIEVNRSYLKTFKEMLEI
ncbi:MAG: LytTR family transcriptional regulator DNA-binding domain-containing protein [Candidatus Izimaplasma sp.]|nr:LytTR family transcriptional regulator DNA-binding domain-containing protein [Candidatus Izimaplasma bacterium]